MPPITSFLTARSITNPSNTLSTPSSSILARSNASESPSGASPSPSTNAHAPGHCAVFPIDHSRLRIDGKPCPKLEFRIREKRALGGRISWVYKHGAELDHLGAKYWLCQRCHLSRSTKQQLFTAGSTSSIADHLRSNHGIKKPGGAAEEPDDCMQVVTPFMAEKWKDIFTDWAIELQLSHKQATY